MRLIDADELKNAIIHQLCIRSENYLLESERGIYNLIDKQPTVEQPKWIPIDERLPEDDGFYLVCGGGLMPWIAECRTFMNVRGWCSNANMPVVKMWMPLPEPPKEGE